MSYAKQAKILIFTILVFFLASPIFSASSDKLQIYSPKYFNEQNNIYEQINYLENEPLSFKFCTDEGSENISFALMCKEDKSTQELEPYEYIQSSKGCYFTNFDLFDYSCDEFRLEIDYILNNKQRKVNREFKKQKESLLINHILEKDYTKLNPVELSYYLIVLNDVQDKNSPENLEIYEKLKHNRNNANKCWPKSGCNIKDTSTVLRNLVLSNYNLNIRMLDDGKSYLEKYIINNENNPSRFVLTPSYEFNGSEEIECSLTIDKDTNEMRNYIFDEQSVDDDEMIIDKEASSNIDFSCNSALDKIELKLYGISNSLIKTQTYNNTKGIEYNIDEFSCIGDSNCDYYDSIDSHITYGSSIKDSSLIGNYLDSLIEENYNERYIQYKNKILDTSKYLYYKKDEDLVNYLKFHQNNDGSWGTPEPKKKILETTWAILGLEKATSNSEYIEDGKKWVYYNEPDNGWGNIEKNVISYLAIKEKLKPYVRVDIKNQISKKTSFRLENPTIYDLKDLQIDFDPTIKPYLSYLEDIGDLRGQEYIDFDIKLDENFFGLKSGEMTITGLNGKNQKITLVEMPINIIGDGIISIKNYDYAVSENNREINVEIESKLDKLDLKCNYKNPFTNEKKQIEINNKKKYFKIQNENLTEGDFTTIIECENQKGTFEIPFEFNVKKINPTLESEMKSYTIVSDNDFAIPIRNLLPTDKQNVKVKVEGLYDGVIEPAEKTKILARNETRDIYFKITNPEYIKALGDDGDSNIIITGEDGYVLKIPISYSSKSEQESSNMMWYIIGTVIIAGTAVLVILRYRHLHKDHGDEEHEEDDEFLLDEDLEFE